MARLHTSGFELRDTQTASNATTLPDPVPSGATPGTINTNASFVRTGSASGKADSAGGTTSTFRCFLAASASRTTFIRAYVYIAAFPSAASEIVHTASTSTGVAIRLNTNGTVQLWDPALASPLGSGFTAQLTVATWHMLELSFTANATPQITNAEFRVDGVSVDSASGLALAVSSTPQIGFGWLRNPGATKVIYFDDLAVNDSTGSSQNSWPGSGKVVLLVPVSQSAAGSGWQKPGGATTNLNTSVDNTPPVGVADSTSSAQAENQVRNATAAANSDVDLNLTDYTSAGISGSDTVMVVQPVAATAAPVATSAKVGQLGFASNPAITLVNLAGASGAFYSGVSAGTYATGWIWSRGTPTYAPTVTLGTSPVIRVRQVTSSTRIAMVCFAGAYVEYAPPAGPTTVTRSAALNATGAIAAAGRETLPRTAAVGATGAIATSALFWTIFQRSAAANATGLIQSAGVAAHIITRSAALNATGAVAASGREVIARTAAINATGAISTVGRETLPRAAALTATGAVSSSGIKIVQRSAAVNATAAIVSIGTEGLARAAALTASGAINTAGITVAQRQATVAATADITSAGETVAAGEVITGQASLTATGTVAADGTVLHVPQTVTGAAHLEATATIEVTISGGAPPPAFVSAGRIPQLRHKVVEAAAHLHATATIDATNPWIPRPLSPTVFTRTATLAATATLNVSARPIRIRTATATLAATAITTSTGKHWGYVTGATSVQVRAGIFASATTVRYGQARLHGTTHMRTTGITPLTERKRDEELLLLLIGDDR